MSARKPLPPRLTVYHALCSLSAEGFEPLARMILSTLEAERSAQGAAPRHKRSLKELMQRHLARRLRKAESSRPIRNIAKPVITIGDDGEAA